MIEASGLTKRYGDQLAVDGLSFQVRPGRVTGFLGPNGAGKSTTMRLILGLDAPTAGSVTVNGRPYRELPAPLREVGALLDARAVHGGRTAQDHLLWLARSTGSRGAGWTRCWSWPAWPGRGPPGRGLLARGWRQRLGIAAALLGDPGVLIFDEPVNGLDTEGIRWIRDLMRRLAAEGRTVLVSSHLMSEMELTADHLLVIGRGRLLADTTMQDFIEGDAEAATLVRSPQWPGLRDLLEGRGARLRPDRQGRWRVLGLDAAAIGQLAAEHGIALHELTPRRSSLEEVYVQMTDTRVEYRATEPGARPAGDHDQQQRRLSMRMRIEPGRAGFAEGLASEWAKFRTVRSTRWTLAAMAAFVLGIAVFVGATSSLQPDDTVLGGSLTGATWACSSRPASGSWSCPGSTPPAPSAPPSWPARAGGSCWPPRRR